jgi:hypothetical protein
VSEAVIEELLMSRYAGDSRCIEQVKKERRNLNHCGGKRRPAWRQQVFGKLPKDLANGKGCSIEVFEAK